MEPISSTGRRESVLNVRNVVSDLERIEEKHPTLEYSDSAPSTFCSTCITDWPCDVVKLARALDHVVKALKMDATRAAKYEAERTLMEVADE